MTWPEALEIMVARRGVERYRVLCADAHPDHAWWRVEMVRMVAAPPPAYASTVTTTTMPTAVSLALTARMKACPYRSVPPGCCSGGRCALRGGAAVSHLDCFPCLTRYDSA